MLNQTSPKSVNIKSSLIQYNFYYSHLNGSINQIIPLLPVLSILPIGKANVFLVLSSECPIFHISHIPEDISILFGSMLL